MSKDSKDQFLRVYSLLRKSRLSFALNLLRDSETNQINKEFLFDRNHAWYNVGAILYRQGKFAEAKAAFKKALRIRPDDLDALMAMGNSYDELKRPRLAERYFRHALVLSEQDPKKRHREAILFNLANSLFDQGCMTEALQLYKLLESAPLELRKKAKKNSALAKNAKCL